MAKRVTAEGPVDGPWALPDGWRWERLGNVLPLSYGKALKATERLGGDIPVYGSAGVTGFHNEALCGEPALIVGRKGSAGAVYHSASPLYAIDTAYFCARSSAKIDLRLAFHLLTFLNLRKLDQSTAVPSLSRDPYNELIVPVPPDAMQPMLSARIDELFAEVDDGEAALARARNDLATWRKALLKAAVTGELTADWRASNPKTESGSELLARVLAERRSRWNAVQKNKGKRYAEILAPDLDGMPILPESWAWTTAEALTSAEKNAIVIGPFGSDLKTSDYRDSGIPLVFVRHIRSGNFSGLRPQFVAEDKARQLAAHLARPGDILVTKMGDPPGDAAIYPSGMPDAIVTADCIRWRPSNVLTAAFLVEWINSHAGQRWIASKTKGVAQQKITLALFRSMPVPVPPADEVAVISRELERLRLELADLADAESDCAALSPVLRQSILAAAFRGDLA
jgi:type I restriction enzyme S subunit